ncbi:hypothetical protein ABW02_25640 [Niallia circulans]|uniref:Uncharacterized protein n=1 Tax=Niallia circulans TaxID=1397 RepID=A0A0J1HPC3_NIACI|nr:MULTISPECIES: hypothetical protein [Bacillaceae]KAB7665666.1 hypothetical protein F9279_19495 [Bacillus sp. B1-b2]KLV15528.1 hypothetical protein ABW02_25640 [Niallia circulans]MCF2649936.1 hypothetical protein [Niallia circulans]
MKKIAVGYFMVNLNESNWQVISDMYKALYEYCNNKNYSLHAVYHDISEELTEYQLLNAAYRPTFKDFKRRVSEDRRIDHVLLPVLSESYYDDGYDDLLEVPHFGKISMFYVNSPEIPEEAYEFDGIPF